MSIKQDEKSKAPVKLKAPVVLEAQVIDGESTIDFGSLEPEGATLVVAYDGIKTGDRVQAWGLTPPNNYDETQVVPDRAISLTFKVPRAYFSGKRSVSFQYFLRADDHSVIAISEAAHYTVTDSVPEPLPAPVIQEAVADSIVVSSLPISGATLLVDYPGAQAGDVITASAMGPNNTNHSETKTSIGSVPMTFKVPKAWFDRVLADGGRATVHSYYVDPVSGDPGNASSMKMYGVE